MSLRNESIAETSLINDQKDPATKNTLKNELNETKNFEETNDSKFEKSKLNDKMEIDGQSVNQTEEINRIRLNDDLINELTKEDLVKKWKQQDNYIDSLEEKLKLELLNKEMYQDNEDKIKQQLFDLTRKENLLIMKLTTKEHEIQDCVKQIQELKLSQISSNDQLQNTFLDPAVNMIFEEMKKEVEKCKLKVEEMQNELSAWKFTPDSNTGKRLMAKCRLLYQENEELGKVISSGRVAKLEGELALQKSFSEEMKKSQGELDEFLFELEEDVEGMQSTIYHLQQQLKEAKDSLKKYQLKEGNQSKDDMESLEHGKDNEHSNNDLIDKKEESTSNEPYLSTETKSVNSSSNNDLKDKKLIKREINDNLNTNLTKINSIKNDQERSNLEERKRSLDEALEEVNASGYLSDCGGLDSIIRKHRKLEQEKNENLLKNG